MKPVEFRAGFNHCGLKERVLVAREILFRRRTVFRIPVEQVVRILIDHLRAETPVAFDDVLAANDQIRTALAQFERTRNDQARTH